MISNRTNIRDVADFYILPKYRKGNIGFFFVSTLFDRYPNQWEVRQLETLKYATAYWRKVIYKYTKNKFEEFNYYNPVWNENLIFQAFDSKSLNNKA